MSHSLNTGDNILIIGNKTGVLEQKVSSMELNHKKIKTARKGQRIAIKTNSIVRENDKVFILRNSK